MVKKNRYAQLIEEIFFKYYNAGDSEIIFERIDIEEAANKLGIALPKNLGDIIYSFRYRADLPENITKKGPDDLEWIIRPAGRAKYKFVLVNFSEIIPSQALSETKILDATPGIIECYAQNDEQALLAKLRYNRLIDIFTGLTCYSLQSHYRTSITDMGQVETDEIYIGVDNKGVHYVIPVQAKGGTDKLGVVQIEQDFAMCAEKFPELVCISIAAQFFHSQIIALFQVEQSANSVTVAFEKHYRLVPPDELSQEELKGYQTRIE